MNFTFSSFARKLFLVFAALSLLLTTMVYLRTPELKLTMDMATSGPTLAQLFYDVGSGFIEADANTERVHSNSVTEFEHLSFPLPAKNLNNLRFDPLTSEGRAVIRNILIESGDRVIQKIPLSKVIPLNQIATRVEHGGEAEFSTTPGANDPMLRIILDQPIQLRSLGKRLHRQQALILNGYLAAFFVVLVLFERQLLVLGGRLSQVNRKISEHLPAASGHGFLAIDIFAVWIYVALFACFTIATALDLNGSSENSFYIASGHGPQVKPLLGIARPIRSDEWSYVTPDILNQYLRKDRFSVENSALGSHSIALFGNVPVKDFTELFRPQYWAFFVLPVDYAYSFYWQFKALLLMTGLFTLFLWITRSTSWSLIGALWFFFSASTQWCYSWPSAITEMTGLASLGIVFFCYLTVGKSLRWLALATLGAIFCAVDFALCGYAPHMIPLLWLTGAMIAAWTIASRKAIFQREKSHFRAASILVTVAIVAAMGLHIFLRMEPAIYAARHTVYPGARSLPGGLVPIWELGFNFMQWTASDTHFPPFLFNICESSGFLWLAPVTLLCLNRLSLSRFQTAAMVAMAAIFVLMFSWCFLPLSAGFGSIFLLNLCPPARLMPVLGLTNVGMVALTCVGFRRKVPAPGQRVVIKNATYFLAAFFVLYLALAATNAKLGVFFTSQTVIASAAFAALLCVFLSRGMKRPLAVSLVLSQVLAFGMVNPIERGLPVYTDSDLARFIRMHRELLAGKWLIYGENQFNSGYFASTGCMVYTGVRYLPDIDHFALFAANGLDLNVANILGPLEATPLPSGTKSHFVLKSVADVNWKVSADDPILNKIGIRYVAFDAKPEPQFTKGLTPLNAVPVDGYWLYQIGPA